MNERQIGTVIGYVGTSLYYIDDQNVLRAAKKLAISPFTKLSSLLSTFTHEEREELEPLIIVLQDPNKLIPNCHAKEVREFIFKRIEVSANELLETPPPPFSKRNIAEISAKIQKRQQSLQISSITGHNRASCVDSLEETTYHQLNWFHSHAGQEYLFGHNLDRIDREMLVGVTEGSQQAYSLLKGTSHIFAPYSASLYASLVEWLPQNSRSQNIAWYMILGFCFLNNLSLFSVQYLCGGLQLALSEMIQRQRDSEIMERYLSPSNTLDSTVSFWSSLTDFADRNLPSLEDLSSDDAAPNSHRFF